MRFAVWSTAAAAGVLAVSGVVDDRQLLSHLILAAAVFFGIPFVIAASMAVVTVPLAVVVLVATATAAASARPTGGGGELVRDALALGWAVVPGYYRALRRVRSPAVWGCVTGLLAAALWLLVRNVGAAGIA